MKTKPSIEHIVTYRICLSRVQPFSKQRRYSLVVDCSLYGKTAQTIVVGYDVTFNGVVRLLHKALGQDLSFRRNSKCYVLASVLRWVVVRLPDKDSTAVAERILVRESAPECVDYYWLENVDFPPTCIDAINSVNQ